MTNEKYEWVNEYYRSASGQESIISDQASFASTKNEKDEFCDDNYSELMSSLM